MMRCAMLLTAALLASAGVRAAAERGSNGMTLGAGAPPAVGLYDANLCVSVNGGAPNCGPVVLDQGQEGRALVLINDVVYRLQPVGEQLGVSLFHGTVQLDGFVVMHKWSGNTLSFSDPEKGARYKLQVGTRRFAPQ